MEEETLRSVGDPTVETFEVIDSFEIADPSPSRALVKSTRKPGANGTHPPEDVGSREMPHSIEAERALLACALLDPTAVLGLLKTQICADEFYSPAHRCLFEAVMEIAHRPEIPDTINVCQALKDRGLLDSVGGPAFVSELTNAVATTANLRSCLDIVRDHAVRRAVIRLATGVVETAFVDFDEVHEKVDALMRTMTKHRASADFEGRTPSSMKIPPDNDTSNLMGKNRYICRGDGGLLVSTSGTGKTSLSIQLSYHLALARPFFGIAIARPSRVLVVQSEDADGDIAECCVSCAHMMKLTAEDIARVDENVCFVRDKINRGDKFIRALHGYIEKTKPDIVILNPLHAYAGCDISNAEEIGKFLREGLNTINRDDKFAWIIIHHTPKPPQKAEDSHARQWNEVMYDAAGSAELVNWARFIITLRARPDPGKFDLNLAKRGKRAGVYQEVPTPTGTRFELTTKIGIEHCGEQLTIEGRSAPLDVIFWLASDVEVVPPGEKKEMATAKGKRAERGPSTNWSESMVLAFFPEGEKAAEPTVLTARRAKEGCGIPSSTFHRMKNDFCARGVVFKTDDHKWFRKMDDKKSYDRTQPRNEQ